MCRGEFFLKIDKRACTSIRHTRACIWIYYYRVNSLILKSLSVFSLYWGGNGAPNDKFFYVKSSSSMLIKGFMANMCLNKV